MEEWASKTSDNGVNVVGRYEKGRIFIEAEYGEKSRCIWEKFLHGTSEEPLMEDIENAYLGKLYKYINKLQLKSEEELDGFFD